MHPVASNERFVLRNEFAAVMIGKNTEANGDRLEVNDLRTGRTFFLDPLELERLTSARHEDLAPIVAPRADELYD